MSSIGRLLAGIACAALGALGCGAARAWGDEGHEIIGLIAEQELEPAVRVRAAALLAADHSGLTRDHSIASESTWADHYRDSDRNTTRVRYDRTQRWHYVDLELEAPDLDAACFRHPALQPGMSASQGPPQDCIVDKLEQFRAELTDPATAADERLLALQFLLHLVGDLHQPLHAGDAHDRGGNDKRATAPGSRSAPLHHYWDTVFVERLGADRDALAAQLRAEISDAERAEWRHGAPADWGWESFELARTVVYGQLPAADAAGVYPLSDAYLASADALVRLQLKRAAVRLALLLNEALAVEPLSRPQSSLRSR